MYWLGIKFTVQGIKSVSSLQLGNADWMTSVAQTVLILIFSSLSVLKLMTALLKVT